MKVPSSSHTEKQYKLGSGFSDTALYGHQHWAYHTTRRIGIHPHWHSYCHHVLEVGKPLDLDVTIPASLHAIMYNDSLSGEDWQQHHIKCCMHSQRRLLLQSGMMWPRGGRRIRHHHYYNVPSYWRQEQDQEPVIIFIIAQPGTSDRLLIKLQDTGLKKKKKEGTSSNKILEAAWIVPVGGGAYTNSAFHITSDILIQINAHTAVFYLGLIWAISQLMLS